MKDTNISKLSLAGRLFRCMGMENLPVTRTQYFFRWVLFYLYIPIFWALYIWAYPKTKDPSYRSVFNEGDSDINIQMSCAISTVFTAILFTIKYMKDDVYIIPIWTAFAPSIVMLIATIVAMIFMDTSSSGRINWTGDTEKIEVK